MGHIKYNITDSKKYFHNPINIREPLYRLIIIRSSSLYSEDLSINGLLVGSFVEEGIELSNISDLDLGDPTLTLGALVDGLSLVLEDAVAGNDLTGDGGKDIGSRLDRLNGSDGLTGRDIEALLGKLDVDDITQRVGGVVSDTDLGYMMC